MPSKAQTTVGCGPTDTFTVTIANGTSLSGAANIGTLGLFAIQMPAAWTSANLTFQVSMDGTNYFNLFDDTGAEVTWVAAAPNIIQSTNPGRWLPFSYIKVRSGTSGVPVNQGADRILTLVTVP